MATYYWVGGSGTWDASTTTHWASSSGGTGGAGVPTSADNVIIDSNSGTGTVTLATSGAVCNDISWNNNSLSFGANVFSPSQALRVYGSMTLASGTTTSGYTTFAVTFAATTTGKTINTNYTVGNASSSLPYVVFNGVGGGWTLLSGFGGGSGNISLTNGSLNTNGYAVEFGTWDYSFTGTFSLTLGTSVCNFTYNWNFNTTTGLTFSGAASTIICNKPSGGVFYGGGLTYGTLQLVPYTSGNTLLTINNGNTFSNIVCTGPATGFTTTIKLPSFAITTVGNFNVNGVSGNQLVVSSTTSGSQAILSKSGGGIISGVDYLNIQDINGTPANTWYVGSHSTNVSNNTGLIFANGFAGVVTEATTLADSQTSTASFVSSITEAILAEVDVESIIATFSAAITEAILAETDVESLVVTFSSAITEALTANDSRTTVAGFVSSVLESTTLADAELVQAAFNGISVENITVQDLLTVITIYNSSQVENINILDTSAGFAWLKIDNTEGTTWSLIDNRQ